MTGDPRPGTAEWDASQYSRVSSPQRSWSEEVIPRLRLGGDETVLDAGCGSGEVTLKLLEQLPHGRVLAVDGSRSMVEAARQRLPADRAEVRHLDLTRLGIESEVDHAFSNAVFHWVADHERLFEQLHHAIRPGGRLVAQCGGRGNVADVERALAVVGREQPFAAHVSGFTDPWNFAGAEQTRERLEAAGFTRAECWLERRTARPEEPQAFLEASGLAPIREVLDDRLFRSFSDRMMEVMEHPDTFEYVRLNIVAERN